METKVRLAYAALLIGTFGAFALAQPAAAQEAVRIGNGNRISQDGRMSGAQTALSIGMGSTAQNGVASIMSKGSVRLGNGNQIDQKGTMTGAQTALAIGSMSAAQNGVASIMSGK